MKRIFWLFWIFCLCPLLLSAQESDLFKRLLKETLKTERPFTFSLNFSDSIFPGKYLQLDATKKYIPRLGFNSKENQFLLSGIEEYNAMKPDAISPYLKASLTIKKYDDLPQTGSEAIVNVVVTPLASIIMINPVEFFHYLMRIGVLSDDPFVPKPSRKERMLKTITQDVYHIDDY